MPHFKRQLVRRHSRVVVLLAAIGAFALLLFVYIALFVHTGTPLPVKVSGSLTAGTPEFVRTFADATHSTIETGAPVTILNNGDEFVPDLVAEIQNASSTIDFSTYIWEEGRFSDQVLGALTDAARRGVAVRLLLDGISGAPSKEGLAAFKEAGGTVGVFHPILSDPLSINNRTHRRSIVIDSEIGYIGGMAVADTWLGGGKKKDEWRDTMFKLSGTMARSLATAFADQWLVSTGEVRAVAPIPEPGSTNTFVHVVGSAGDLNRPIAAAFLLTALSAEKSLYISNPYVLPDAALMSVLMEKARSGVDVRILVPGPNTDGPLIRWASQYYYAQLLASGVRIYEYQPTLMHEKAMVADGVWSLIGSANIDNRSAELNDENVMGIDDPVLAGQLIDVFYADLDESLEITKDGWGGRGVLHRILSWVGSIPFKQY